MKFKVGDFCYSEFDLVEIKEIEKNPTRITEISDGYFNRVSHNLNDDCLPISLRTKILSEKVKEYHSKISELSSPNLNFPDIHRKYVHDWKQMCLAEDAQEATEMLRKLENFTYSIIEKVNQNQLEEIDNIKIFKG